MSYSLDATPSDRFETRRAELSAMLRAKQEAAIEAEKRGAFVLTHRLNEQAETLLDELLAL